MNSRIKPQLGRAGDMLLSVVAKADVKILPGMGDMMRHGLERAPAPPHPSRTDEHLHRAIEPLHEHSLTFFNRLIEHSCIPVPVPPMANESAFRFGWRFTFKFGKSKCCRLAIPVAGEAALRNCVLGFGEVDRRVCELLKYRIRRLALDAAIMLVNCLKNCLARSPDQGH